MHGPSPVLAKALADFIREYRLSGAPSLRMREVAFACFPKATDDDFDAGLALANSARASNG